MSSSLMSMGSARMVLPRLLPRPHRRPLLPRPPLLLLLLLLLLPLRRRLLLPILALLVLPLRRLRVLQVLQVLQVLPFPIPTRTLWKVLIPAPSIDITMGTSIPTTNRIPSTSTLPLRIIVAPCTTTISTLMMSIVNMTSLIASLVTSYPALMTTIHLIMISAASLTTLIPVPMIILSGTLAPMMMSMNGITTTAIPRHTPAIVCTTTHLMTKGLTRTMLILANRRTRSNFQIHNPSTLLM